MDWKWAIELTLKFVGGIWALSLFARKIKAEHAGWVTTLYEKFYENDDLKAARDVLDCGDANRIKQFAQKQGSEFTDYLNFFEYVAYLWEANQLTTWEVEVLFGYYLDCMRKNADVRGYIAELHHGFDRLDAMLNCRELK